MSLLYCVAFAAVVLLDTLCLKYVLLPLVRGNQGMPVRMSLPHAFVGTLTAAVLIGMLLLEGGGRIVIWAASSFGIREVVAIMLVKNTYATLAPLFNATYLVLWARWILKFRLMWPAALVGGVILHYVDFGIVVPWFFRLAEAIAAP